ncbi:MAG: trypsin-like peptidase domain-containing protein [Acidobacteriota bacterium]|nr:trypsin-like peptidase domain-containing protein [Acidobacteriota bacterium]
MQRIVVRHLSGSKANQVEEFPLNHFSEIILGRDPSSTVKYDPDRDDLVGRQHAKIAADPNDAEQFVVSDLNSRNGTYLNKQRIVGSARISPGDHIQLGPGGPELQFDLEPRPANTVKATRSAALDSLAPTIQGATTVPSTRQVDLGTPSTRSVITGTPGSGTSSGTVGKATVERMISQNIAITKRTEGRRYMMLGGVALALIIIGFGVVAGYLYLGSSRMQQELSKSAASAPLDSTAVAKTSKNTVVQIEVAWKLISPKGGLVYHEWNLANGFLYIQLPGKIEPKLTYNENLSYYNKKSIGDNFNASGVVVSNDGFILTSHHVAAAWETPFDIPDYALRGTLVDPSGIPVKQIRNIKEEREFGEWIPSETKQEIFSLDKKKSKIPEGSFSGRNDRLTVSFPGSTEGNNARQVKASDDYDVAMIKVDLPGTLPKAELYDNLESVKQGGTVFVMGYPFSTLSVSSSKREIPEPSISTGNIGKLIRTQDVGSKRRSVYSKIGDAYQLTVNSADQGYDGAPVFDDRARVIGIFNVSKNLADSTINLAVPIRYGIELMSVTPVK